MSETLEIVPYDATWPRRFELERRRIADALGPIALRIDHNGSTAVPALAAKPIIDIQISVAPLHPIGRYGPRLAALGYVHHPHPDDAFCPFFGKPAEWPRTHHVHVVASGSEEERRTLAFRDFLRAHADARRAYEALKRELAPRFAATQFESRQAYADAKGAFIEEIVARALAAGHPRELAARAAASAGADQAGGENL